MTNAGVNPTTPLGDLLIALTGDPHREFVFAALGKEKMGVGIHPSWNHRGSLEIDGSGRGCYRVHNLGPGTGGDHHPILYRQGRILYRADLGLCPRPRLGTVFRPHPGQVPDSDQQQIDRHQVS